MRHDTDAISMQSLGDRARCCLRSVCQSAIFLYANWLTRI